MDIFLGLLVLSGLFALFQLLLPGRSGRGIGIAQWLSWIALATALVAFVGSGRAGETVSRLTGNFFDRTPPSPSPTIVSTPIPSPLPIPSPTTSLTPPPPTTAPDNATSLVAIEGWNQIPQNYQLIVSQPFPSPSPTPVPSPIPIPSPVPTPVPSPIPTPVPTPVPSPVPIPSPVPTPIPTPPTTRPPINGLW